MKKLLIVEDEKIIRQGIKAMVMRSLVPIEEVILCKNGEEAYEIVKNNQIDVMITDIRMPKKDGITLVKEIQSLPYVPKVIVISGYDDFSYAVELLRYGAKEYLLKPIERDKISMILQKLEQEINAEEIQLNENLKIGCQQFKYMLLNNSISEEEVLSIESKFKDYFFDCDYVICCTNYKTLEDLNRENVIFLDDINGQSVFILKASDKEEVLSNLLKDHFVGVSRVHKNLRELKEGYAQALYARKYAFATGSFIIEYNRADSLKETVSEEMIEQFVQMVGTDKLEEANKFLIRILYKTKQGQIEPDRFMSIMNAVVERICANYKNVLDFNAENLKDLKNVFEYDNAGSYFEAISAWIEAINDKLLNEFDDYKNKQKMQKAMKYIQENFDKDLNMAVVSNYISMNYSLFSYVFKQYTGMNFVNFLKTIRINEAKRLLEETDKKIIEISSQVGYENEKHFMKLFKTVCGVSPSEYRKNAQVGKLNLIP
ncbi:response regulator [Anaerocolumna sp. AGMB13025]|uniref:response regulator transcription factor n=1 Tax=Anaerocolumna sp. AGMB13025 TaxID=3039116 RepID=UPI00241F5449|nr:response regulator [Anaerocolumna sp. AGMB13025]WFR59355.1 response regulator [Anaerocolumna sp. AGMB13025]